jgi:hypothetical protein
MSKGKMVSSSCAFVGILATFGPTIASPNHIYTQQIAKIMGNHSMTAGLIVQRQDAGRTDYNTATFGYSSLDNFLNNVPSKVQITFDLDPFNIHTYQFGGFLQDDWKLSSNLTFNLGLRYDYYEVPKEDSGRLFNRGIDSSAPALSGGYGSYRSADSLYKADFNNVQPRMGFSWSLGPHQNTVVRGGAGVFVGPHPIYGGPIDEVQNSASVPFRITLIGAQAANSGLAYPLVRADFTKALATLQDAGVISKEVVNTSISRNFPNPYSLQWMFGVEQQLRASHRIEVDYIGNRGLKENMTLTKNLPDRTTGVLPRPALGQPVPLLLRRRRQQLQRFAGAVGQGTLAWSELLGCFCLATRHVLR